MRYNIGDIVQMNSTWDNRYGIIIAVDDDRENDMKYPVYRIIIQGHPSAGWLSEAAIYKSIYRKVE